MVMDSNGVSVALRVYIPSNLDVFSSGKLQNVLIPMCT